MVIMNDLEWGMLSYYVIYYEKFLKVMQWTEKVALNTLIECNTTLSYTILSNGFPKLSTSFCLPCQTYKVLT